MPILAIRADSGPAIGGGHAMRCLALAQAWRERRGGVRLIAAESLGWVESRYREEGAEVVRVPGPAGSPADAEGTAEQLGDVRAVVLDGYGFDGEYQERIRTCGHPVLLVDDGAQAPAHRTDLILDCGIAADPSRYSDRLPSAQLLLGPRYALLRREFRELRRRPRRRAAPIRVMVAFGAVDEAGATLRVLEALVRIPPGTMACTLVVGAANRRRSEILDRAAGLEGVEVVVDPADLAARMAAADIALASASTMAWEFARAGCALLLVRTAVNQEPVARGLAAVDAAVDLGWHAEVTTQDLAGALQLLARDSARRRGLAAAARSVIDGHGAVRVTDALARMMV